MRDENSRGTFPSPPEPAQLRAILPQEIPATLQLYLDGKIEQFWLIEEHPGVVFILNAASVEEANAWLEALPPGEAKLMTSALTVIGPFRPFSFFIDGKLPSAESG